MTLQEAKDKAAKEFNRSSYKSIEISIHESEGNLEYIELIDKVTNRAMELYAESKTKAAIKEVLDVQSNVEVKYKNIIKKEAFNDIWNAAIDAAAESAQAFIGVDDNPIVGKQSILKLKKFYING